MIRIGNTELKSAYIGSTPISAIYVGAVNVWLALKKVVGTFIQRVTAGGETIGNGDAKVLKVYGNSIVWNQQVNIPASSATRTQNGVTITDNRDGSYTANGTATADIQYMPIGWKVVAPSEHKTLYLGCPQGGSLATYRLSSLRQNNEDDFGNGGIYSTNTINGGFCAIVIKSGTICDNLVFRLQTFDLTQMFGAGNEATALGVPNLDTQANKDTAIANFRKMFPKSYYPYNAGEIKDFASIPNVEGWNQLAAENFFEGFYRQNCTSSHDSSNVYTVISDIAGRCYFYKNSLTAISGHKYFFSANTTIISGKSVRIGGLSASNQKINEVIGIPQLVSSVGTAGGNIIQFDMQFDTYVAGDSYRVSRPIIIDLTAIFGAGNEPATTAAFESWCVQHGINLDEWQPYNAGGTLLGTRIESKDSGSQVLGYCKFPTCTLRKAGTAKDLLNGNTITRNVGVRAYQSGDEDDATLLTDKTNTNYPLSTPTTEQVADWTKTYTANNGGTEQVKPANEAGAVIPAMEAEIGYQNP